MTEAAAEVTPKPGRTIVTGETVDAFVVQKLAEKANPGAAADTVSDGTGGSGSPASADQSGGGNADDGISPSKSAGEPEPDSETDAEIKKAGKKNPKIEARFHDLAEKRKAAEKAAEEARAEAQRVREEAAQAARERDELKAKYEPPKPEVLPPKPARAQFGSDADYEAALEDWAGDKREHDLRQQEAQEAAEKAHKARVTAFQKREAEAKTEIPDYEDAIKKSTVKVSDPVRDAIVESDVAGFLLHHLATNPAVAEKLAGMSIASSLKELGKIEDRIIADREKKAKGEPKTPLAEVSKAPPPIAPLRGGGAVDTPPVDSSGNFHGTFQQYQAWKKAEIAKGRWR